MLNFVISDRLTIAPNDTTWMITRCLVAGGIWQIRVFRTLDGGQNWEPPTMPPLPTTPRDFSGELTYAIHAIDDQTVIVGYRNNAETTFSTSTDAGRTWNAAVVVRENGNFVTPTLSISHNGPIVYATMSMSANQGTTYRGANNGMGPWTMAQNSLQGSRSRVLVSGTGPTARLTVISNATGTSIQVATDGDPLILAAPQVLSAVRTTTVDWELRGETLFITSRSPDAYRLPLAMPDLAQSLAYNTGGSGSERAVTSDSAGNFYTFGLALAGPAYRNSVQRIPAGPVAMAETPIFSYPEPGDIAAYNRRTGALIVVVRDSTPPNPLLSAFIQY